MGVLRPQSITAIALLLLVGTTPWTEAGVFDRASLWLNEKWTHQSCQDLTRTDFEQVRETLEKDACRVPETGTLQLHESASNIAEFIYLNAMANEQYQRTQCALDGIRFFTSSPDLIRLRAKEMAIKWPLMLERWKSAQAHAARIQLLQTEINGAPSSAGSACFSTASCEKLGQLSITLGEERKALAMDQGLLLALESSLWSGTTSVMRKFIESKLAEARVPTPDEFETSLNTLAPRVASEYAENLRSLQKQASSTPKEMVFDRLNDETKRRLIENSISNGFFSDAVKGNHPALVKLLCRLEGKYTQGRDLFNLALGASTFALSGVGWGISHLPLAIRALELTEWGFDLESVGVAAGISGAGVNLVSSLGVIQKSCFESRPKLLVRTSCPSDSKTYFQAQVSEIQSENCLLQVALNLAPPTLRVGSAAYKSLLSKLKPFTEEALRTAEENPGIFPRLRQLGSVVSNKSEICCKSVRTKTSPSSIEANALDDPYTAGSPNTGFLPQPGDALIIKYPETLRGTSVSDATLVLGKRSASSRVEEFLMPTQTTEKITAAGAGAHSTVYFYDPAAPAESTRVWLKNKAKFVLKVLGGTKNEAGKEITSEVYVRDLAMRGVAEELAEATTYQGKRFIRVAKDFSSPESRKIGITVQEAVHGRTAAQLKEFLSIVKKKTPPEEVEYAREALRDAGYNPDRRQSMDELRDSIGALDQFYRATHDNVLRFARKNKLIQFYNMTSTHHTAEVALDYNRGSNVIWDAHEKIWVMIDW